MKSTGNDSWQRERARSYTESEGEQRRVEQRADISYLKHTLFKWSLELVLMQHTDHILNFTVGG